VAGDVADPQVPDENMSKGVVYHVSAATDGWGNVMGDTADGAGYVVLATGYLGGRGNAEGAWQGPLGLHTDGSNFAMADGHVKWLLGDKVSSGLKALTADCNQGGASTQPSDCANQQPYMAAGTADSSYAATFSTN
jgi:prepilin-type processing-associated H-X9-DG protein